MRSDEEPAELGRTRRDEGGEERSETKTSNAGVEEGGKLRVLIKTGERAKEMGQSRERDKGRSRGTGGPAKTKGWPQKIGMRGGRPK